jgi:hypothetical protein
MLTAGNVIGCAIIAGNLALMFCMWREKAVARRLGGEASASRNGLDTHNSHCLSPNAPEAGL